MRCFDRATLSVLCLLLLVACGSNDEPDTLHLQELPSPAGPDSLAPRLSVDEEGRLLLSWLQALDEGRHALRFAWHDGESWTEAETVAEGADWFANWADTPGVRPVGDWLFAHWLVRSGPGTYHYNIMAAWSDDDGASWGEPFILHQQGRPAEHGFLSSVAFPEGELGVAWLDGRHTLDSEGSASHPMLGGSGAMSLRWARLRPGESDLHRDRELDDRVCDCCMTATVLETQGPRVFYRDRSEDEIRDISTIAPESDDGRSPERVFADDWRIPACPVNGPAAARLKGATAVAWYSAPESEGRVSLALRDDQSGDFSSPLRVDTGRPLGRVSLVATGDDTARLFWMEQGESGGMLMGRDAGPEGLSPASALKTMAAGRASGFPVAAVSPRGVMLAWTEAGEGRRSVRVGRVFSAREE